MDWSVCKYIAKLTVVLSAHYMLVR